jgi:hypothetical protein
MVFGDEQFEAMVPLDHGRREIEKERVAGAVAWALGCVHELRSGMGGALGKS